MTIKMRRRSREPGRRNPTTDDDLSLLQRLRDGDEDAFVTLVARHHDSMFRLARTYVRSDAIAEEVVQETWIAALKGVDRFEGRSSMRTWLLAILANRARTVAVKEARTVPAGGPEDAAVGPARFDAQGLWISPPVPWEDDMLDRLGAESLRSVIRSALLEMPERQRAVVMLRDVDGLGSDEVCQVLAITAANERVLLHRGRSRLRQALETSIAPESSTTVAAT